MSHDVDPQVHQWLAALPDREPPPDLWAKILNSRLRQQQLLARRNGFLAAGGAAAALVLALMLGLVMGQRSAQPTQVVAAPASQLAALMARTEQLERALREQRSEYARLASTQQQLVRAQQAQLIALDQSLAQAYARNEPAATLERLWQRRVSLMSDLVSMYEKGNGAGSV